MDLNNISIHSACDIDSTLLMDFFRKAFPERFDSLCANWKWLYHSAFYDDKIPLVVVHDNKVIAFFGMIPFKIHVLENTLNSGFLMDFFVLPEYRRMGLGGVLTSEYQRLCDVLIGLIGNEKSINHLKKYGFDEVSGTYMHLIFIKPFNYPGFNKKVPVFLRKILNIASLPFYLLTYNITSYSKTDFKIERFSETGFRDFTRFYESSDKALSNKISPARDSDYVSWRIFNSPRLKNYYLYKTPSFHALIALQGDAVNSIDVLWVTDTSNKTEIKKMLATLGIYAAKNKISYLRFYTNNHNISGYIKSRLFSCVRHPRFVYYSGACHMVEHMDKPEWDFQLIDTDFEHAV